MQQCKLSHLLWKCKMHNTLKNRWKNLLKINYTYLNDAAIPLLKTSSCSLKQKWLQDYLQVLFFYNLYLETTQTPVNCRIEKKKKAVIYSHKSIFYTVELTAIRKTTSNNMNESTSVTKSKVTNSKENICNIQFI